MSMARKIVFAATLSVIAWVSVGLVVAQSVRIDTGPYFRLGGRQVIRFWEDFTLRPGDRSRDVLVVAGATVIAGEVDGDIVSVLGPLRLEKTAVVRGSVFVTAGDLSVVEGARVDRDLCVVGSASSLPASFYPGGEHIIIGNPWMGERIRALVPWITYGLLWGRVIVVSIGWVWWFVAITLILTMAINLMLHSPVGRSADTLATRPVSAFMTGLLMLLLTGPVAVLLGATIIGLAVVPFLLCAVVLAWIVGKVAVSRWIGRSILGHGPEETRLEGLGAVVVGFAAICLLYAVPIVGIVTWALVGVLGLGTASLTAMGALRRERGPSKKKGKKGESDQTDVASPPPATPATPLEHPGLSYARSEPVYEPPIIPPVPPAPAAYAAEPEPASHPPAPAPAGGAAAMPLIGPATFMDRLAAGALDVMFVLVVFNMFLDRYLIRDGEAQFMLLFAYFITFWAWKGTTLGGMVCNLRVKRADGGALTGSDAVVRGLASLFSFVPFGLGFFWILRDPQQQAWHDKISGTVVVKVPRDYPL
jgi:uncharacterized RDD family membrane protein YckC